MIQEIINKWEENKYKLEEYFKTTNKTEYREYEDIVKKVFEICINTSDFEWENFNLEKMTIIDDGDYQGTQIFIIPKDTYQPSVDDYIVTNTYYGSCSGCDTLKAISYYDDELPTKEELKKYMTLALHLLQKTQWLSNNK